MQQKNPAIYHSKAPETITLYTKTDTVIYVRQDSQTANDTTNNKTTKQPFMKRVRKFIQNYDARGAKEIEEMRELMEKSVSTYDNK